MNICGNHAHLITLPSFIRNKCHINSYTHTHIKTFIKEIDGRGRVGWLKGETIRRDMHIYIEWKIGSIGGLGGGRTCGG